MLYGIPLRQLLARRRSTKLLGRPSPKISASSACISLLHLILGNPHQIPVSVILLSSAQGCWIWFGTSYDNVHCYYHGGFNASLFIQSIDFHWMEVDSVRWISLGFHCKTNMRYMPVNIELCQFIDCTELYSCIHTCSPDNSNVRVHTNFFFFIAACIQMSWRYLTNIHYSETPRSGHLVVCREFSNFHQSKC